MERKIIYKWMDKVSKNKFLWYSCIICFLLLFLYAILNKVDVYIGDADHYSKLADKFYDNGVFSFTNFPDDPRGYMFPFLLLIFKGFGQIAFHDPSTGFLMINSMMLTSIFCVIIPKLFCIPYNRKYFFSAIVTTVCFIYYWPDFLRYPLTDMYAIFFFSISIICIMKVEQRMKEGSDSIITLALSMLVLGVSMYTCYNIRKVYQLPSIALLLFFLIKNWKRLNIFKGKRSSIIIIAVFGYFITALPQMQINQKYNETYSSTVITDKFFGEDLTLKQLYWGILYTRYETNIESYISSKTNYPRAGVKFVDKSGYALIDENTEKSYMNMIKSYVQHPIAYFKLYARHLINGIMPIYRETYITNMNANKWLAFLLNYGILLLCVVVGYVKRKKLWTIPCYILGLLFVAIIAVPGAIETRFMLPAFIVVYGIAFYMFDWGQLKQLLSNKKICIILVLLSFLGFLFTYRVISTTLRSTEHHVQFTIGG